MLIWLENAPVFGVDNDDKVIAFIDKIISCKRPTDNPELLTCEQASASPFSYLAEKIQDTMSFQLPQPPMRSTKILYPLDIEDSELTQHKNNW